MIAKVEYGVGGAVSNGQLIRHTPRLSDVVNMLFIVAAALGSCAILVAKYIYESSLRRAEYMQDGVPFPVGSLL